MNPTIFVLAAALAAAQAPKAAAPLRGTVAETLEAGPYVYVRVAAHGGDVWAAVAKAPLAVGEPVTVLPDVVMENFQSKTLGRKFERVVFGTLAAASPSAAATRAEGAEGRTVAEVHAQKAALKGKTVAVRGRVVKSNAQIMGANWLHLRDGSGSAKGKDDDLVVTTQDSAAVGDVVVARGTVALAKDLGSGYFFPVLVENARIVK